MKLSFMVGGFPARKFFTGLKQKPEVGDVFEIVDKKRGFLKPVKVQLTEIKTHIGGGDIYFVKVVES